MTTRHQRPLSARIAGQGVLLFSGFALAQLFSFLRNALLAHMLSKGDFGVAAAILLLLQTIETLSDVGADRLIVQDRDGDDARFVASAHTVLVLRGLLTAAIILAVAQPIASFFDVRHAAWAFAAIALSPAIKGFLHLDSRRVQRHLDNRPQMMIEVAPQALALVLVLPAVAITGSYAAVVGLSVVQAAAAVAVSHVMAERRYALALERAHLVRLVAFGWPIWASAFPLVAVYQGDRALIGHMAGMEALAAYSVAFMITMVPGLVAAKVANALMLPLLADARDTPAAFAARFTLMVEMTALACASYLAVFVMAGGSIVALAFGPDYAGLGDVVALLSLMWAMRMMQATLGIAMMARGVTRPFLVAGAIRSLGVPLAFAALYMGHGLVGAAFAGVVAELLSLLYVAWRLQSVDAAGVRLGSVAMLRSLVIIAAGGSALATHAAIGDKGLIRELAAAGALVVPLLVAGLLSMPGLHGLLKSKLVAEPRTI